MVDVSDVQEIENPMALHDAISVRPPVSDFLNKFLHREDLGTAEDWSSPIRLATPVAQA